MVNTSAHTLRLLSLLLARRYWPGPLLAGRLGVSARTLRRDIDRLRQLGYWSTPIQVSTAATPSPRCGLAAACRG